MTDEQNKLAEIRARAEKATPGPWHILPNPRKMAGVHSEECKIYHSLFDPECLKETHDRQKADAVFIAHARTDIPYLLDLVAAKEERIVELEQSVKDDELAFNTSQDLIGKLEEDLEVAKQELLVAEERIKEQP